MARIVFFDTPKATEKVAIPGVFNMLLQVMDYGKLTHSNGRPSIFVM